MMDVNDCFVESRFNGEDWLWLIYNTRTMTFEVGIYINKKIQMIQNIKRQKKAVKIFNKWIVKYKANEWKVNNE